MANLQHLNSTWKTHESNEENAIKPFMLNWTFEATILAHKWDFQVIYLTLSLMLNERIT